MVKNSDEFCLVFEDGDPLNAEIVRAALVAADIDCFVKNEGVQNLFAMGSMGGMNPLIGTVKVFVRHEDRLRAEALLTELQTIPDQEKVSAALSEPSGKDPQEVLPESSRGNGFLSLLRRWFFK